MLRVKVSLLTVRVLKQLSAIRKELIKTNYPSSLPPSYTPCNGSDGIDGFEVSGYYGKIARYNRVISMPGTLL